MCRVPTKNQRSRRCLLLAGLIFLAVQIAVGLFLDLSLPKIRFQGAVQVVKAASELGRSPDIVFVGSSRFKSGLNMGEFQEFMSAKFGQDAPLMFNAAIAGADPFAMDYVVRLLYGHGTRQKMAIVEVGPDTVKLRCSWIHHHIVRMITWKDMPDVLRDVIKYNGIPKLLASRIIPVFLYRRELLTWIFSSPPPYLKADGAAKAKGRPASTDAREDSTPDPAEVLRLSRISARETAKMFENYQIGGINAQHLESLLAYLHQRNVAVILVRFPASKAFLDCYTPEIDRKFMDYIEYLTRAYGGSFVDYRDRVPNEFFRDTLHLTPAGAVVFSRMLASEVLRDAWMSYTEPLERSASMKRGGE